jgi:hypothetical protein
MKKIIKLLYYLQLIITLTTSVKILKLNFERNLTSNLTPNNLMSNLYNNDIFTIITLGSNLEKIPISFKMNSFPFYIITSETNQSKNIFFHNEKSTSYYKEKNDLNTNFTDQDFIKGKLSSETIIFNNENSFQKIEKFNFISITNINEKNIINEAGTIGLNIINSHFNLIHSDFILQLKNKQLINSFPFTFKYTNSKKEKGEFILGALPDEYDKYYNSSKYKFSLTKIYAEKPIWALDFDKIIYFKQLNTFSNLFFFRIEIGLVISPNSYKKFFKDSFFNQTKCYEEIFKSEDLNEFYYFYCDSSVDISKFGNLNFYNHIFNMNFTLNEKDLFYYFKKRNYFLIVFSVKSNYDWILGSPFLKKYQMIFDKDKKIISIYEKDDNHNISFAYIIIFILIVIIIFLVFYIVFYLFKNKRKLRANEIDENFEYLPQS